MGLVENDGTHPILAWGVIDLLAGLVLDYEVVSKYCFMCTFTSAKLGENCPEFRK